MQPKLLSFLIALCCQVSLGQEEDWPPEWLEGAWEVTSMEVAEGGNKITTAKPDFLVFAGRYMYVAYRDRIYSLAFQAGQIKDNVAVGMLQQFRDPNLLQRVMVERSGDAVKFKSDESPGGAGPFQLNFLLEAMGERDASRRSKDLLRGEYSKIAGDAKKVFERWIRSIE